MAALSLIHDLPTSVEYFGKRYKLRTAYDDVLQAMAIDDSALPNSVKTEAELSWLIKGTHPIDYGLLEAAYGALLPPEKVKFRGQTYMDPIQDSPYIYASFRQAYGIDLLRERGRMHFSVFLALLQSLPDETKMARVVDIRRSPLPEDPRAASEMVDLKAIYALERKDNQQTINQIGKALEEAMHGGRQN